MGATCGAIGQGRWWLLSSHIFEAREKKTIGKFSRLGKAVDALADKKIDLTITDTFGEFVFINELLGNVG